MEFLKALPEFVWGAVLGFFFSLTTAAITTWLANRHARRQQSAQLEHDAAERKREREMQLRRDVYLPAADAVTSIFTTLGQLSDLAVPVQQIAATFASSGPALARVQVVAGPKAVKAVAALYRECGAALMQAMKARMPVDRLRSNATILYDLMEQRSQEVSRYVELMKQYNLQGEGEEKWARLNRQVDIATAARERYAAEWNSALRSQTQEHLSYVESTIPIIRRVTGLFEPALVAIRAELEVPDGDKVIADELRQTAQLMEQSLNSLLEQVRSDLREQSLESR